MSITPIAYGARFGIAGALIGAGIAIGCFYFMNQSETQSEEPQEVVVQFMCVNCKKKFKMGEVAKPHKEEKRIMCANCNKTAKTSEVKIFPKCHHHRHSECIGRCKMCSGYYFI